MKTVIKSISNLNSVCAAYISQILIRFPFFYFGFAERVLRYCESPSVGTCCTYNMESRMAAQSRQQLEWHTKEQITKMSGLLGGKATKFNGKLATN